MAIAKLNSNEAQQALKGCHSDWQLTADGHSLTRHFKIKPYAAALALANQMARLSEEQDHHGDICFGWGYCTITMTTHDVKGLSARDFRLAEAIDKLALS